MKNIFREPAEPFTLFNYSDFLIFTIINLLIYLLLKNRILKWTPLCKRIFIILLFIIVPILSCQIESNNVHNKFEIVDGFNLLYIYFKFPLWWMLGLFNYWFINKKMKTSL
jgi:hypothetical protein